jgi:hypothetical protein
LKFQCTRHGSQNHQFCPGSIQDTFIIFLDLTTRFSKKNPQRQNLENRKFGTLTKQVKVSLFVSAGTVIGRQGKPADVGSTSSFFCARTGLFYFLQTLRTLHLQIESTSTLAQRLAKQMQLVCKKEEIER